MASRIKRELDELKAAEPGVRFQAGYERTHVRSRVLRLLLIALGFALMVAAAVTFWLPGPNFVLVLAGLALVGGQAKFVARAMDRAEIAARRWHQDAWEPFAHKRAVAACAVILVLAAVALIALILRRQGLLPGWLEDLLP